jgi:cytochrome c biogenesis protein ResB
MPKLFASDIVIHDKETGEKIPARVEVNHPARHRASRSTSPALTTAGRQ